MKDVWVTRTEIIGTDTVVYSAWEPYDGHSTRLNGGNADRVGLGRIGTRRLPDHLEQMAGGSWQRADAVRDWQITEYDEAYRLIVADHPHLGVKDGYKGIRNGGTIAIDAGVEKVMEGAKP